VAYISSVVPSALLPTDLLADPTRPEFRSSGLKTLSVVRLHKLATIHARNVVRGLGRLESVQREAVEAKLRAFLGLG